MGLGNIDHVVVLMLENRSFDSMLGTLYPKSARFEGLAGTESNPDDAGKPVAVWNSPGTPQASMSIPAPDPGEQFTDIDMQLFGTATPAPSAMPTMSGFVRNYLAQGGSGKPHCQANAVMHHFTPDQLPVLSGLAKAFAVCDHWFASAPCQTWPNRFFVHTATANGYENNTPTHFPYEMASVFQQMEAKACPWKVYFHDIPQALTLAGLWPHIGNFRLFEEFEKDARSGGLPAYSFIEPRYFSDLTLPNDQHSPHVVTLGEQLIATVYNALRAGPQWSKTLFIITYDEHGGCFDHVPPPAAVPPGDTPTAPFNFDRYGVRVPAVIVSPFIPPGTILRAPAGNTPYDHTSIIATLRKRFDLGPPLTKRDAAAPDLSAVLTLDSPGNDGPASVTALDYAPSPSEIATAHMAPLNDHQTALASLAAHLPATMLLGVAHTQSHLEQLRAGAVSIEQKAVRNIAAATQFIKGRLRDLFASL